MTLRPLRRLRRTNRTVRKAWHRRGGRIGRGVTLGPAEVQRWQFGHDREGDGRSLFAFGRHDHGSHGLARAASEAHLSGFEPRRDRELQVLRRRAAMIVKIPHVAADEEARAIIVCELERNRQLPPEKTDGFAVPDPKTLKAGFKEYLGPAR